MVDLQAHVLPGADRGAEDEAAALAMCRYAAEHGTRELVAAPKTDLSESWDAQAVDAALERLQQQLGDTIHLHRGCEIQLKGSNEQLVMADPGRYTLNGRQYLLVEVTEEMRQRGSLPAMLDRLHDLGAVPVIASPERSGNARPGRLSHWVNRGALVQICGGSLTGSFGERAQSAAAGLVDANLAHFVVSDGYDLRNRTPDLLEAWDYIVYRWGETKARQLLIENPWAALWGERIEPGDARIRKAPSLQKSFLSKKRRKRRRRKT